MPRPAHPARALVAAALGLALTGTAHAQRPAPGDGYQADLELSSTDSARFRVWYVTESIDAVQPEDENPADGVPDFAAEVALVAEESHRIFTEELGFRPPLTDTDYLPADQAGGDERFDIYLMNLMQADGSYEIDQCQETPSHCSGFFVMENDFAGFSYPSDAVAIRILVSHEYFHAVHSAYDTGQDVKWTEGTAVWAEEQAFPGQTDFQLFVRYFLEKPFRAFDRPSGATFGDLYPYGAALWPQFLTERYGPDVVREIWEACEDTADSDPRHIDAAAAVLEDVYDSTLREAWIEFTRWNLFTDVRADASRAYQNGADLDSVAFDDPPEVPADGLLEVEMQIEGMSARYLVLALPDLGGEPRTLSLVTDGIPVPASAAVATVYLDDGGRPGEALELVADADGRSSLELSWQGTPSLYVVVTGVAKGAPMRTTRLAMELPAGVPDPDDKDTGGCSVATGVAGSTGSTGPIGAWLLLAGLGLLLARRRRA